MTSERSLLVALAERPMISVNTHVCELTAWSFDLTSDENIAKWIALNRFEPTITGKWAPVVVNKLKQHALAWTHWGAQQRQIIP